MKEDYLWDKIGEDAEIETLEIALQTFRYQEKAIPALSAKVLPFKKEAPRKVFRFVLAAAACLAFGITALGIWLQFSKNKIQVKGDLAENTQSQNPQALISSADETNQDLIDLKSTPLSEKKVKNHQERLNRVFVKTRQTPVSSNVAKSETKAQKVKTVKTDVRLTKEEKYAYDQLMRALSITSSKLKIVKDKVEGNRENDAASENGR